ncbi:MAG: type II toxin-antitoxin system RelE/ParE family toxin [Firmicutes bacterium]|nr:type II toxin-antitoxin system RelE/ParE family toxin [Bacillota bacterium]
MSYKVELSELASMQYDKFLEYIYYKLENPQAANDLMQDFDDTIDTLSEQADYLGYCRSERLRQLGFHKIRLKKHRYLLVYRVKVDKVIVEGMYHELQDYEKTIT